MTDVVTNLAGVPAAASRTTFYLSVDRQKSAGDLLLGFRDVPALGPHRTSKKTVSATIPTGTPVGSYYIVACADDPDKVLESSETDNCQATGNYLKIAVP
jgi:hypothetical protein